MRQRTVAKRDLQPTGFRGAVPSFPATGSGAGPGSVLRLPLGNGRGDVPEGTFARIEVTAFTESMGPIERFASTLAQRLEKGGTLLFDLDHESSVRSLRTVLEGRPGTFEPAGSCVDPTRPLPLKRTLAAFDAAGLFVDDVVAVPGPFAQLHDDFAVAMFGQGFLPIAWVNGAPPVRFWISCTLRAPMVGTVVVGPGDEAQRLRTENCLRAFLPEDWQMLRAEGTTEAAAFSRAIAEARGERIWFLRAGSIASRELFDELSLCATLGAAAPAVAGVRCAPGDLSGMMIPRLSMLAVGPLPERANSQVAYEEYCMQLDTTSGPCGLADGAFVSPPPPVEAPREFAREATEMMRIWQPVQDANVRPGDVATKAVQPPPWRGRSPRITLCMIARNEERFLADCLRRAAPCVDEIVLVDTGSTDRTIEIAESFGAKVVQRAWDDDFSAPRNEGLRHATGDWILVLDADEFVGPTTKERIRELALDEKAAGYLMRFVNVVPGQKSVGVMMVRLFRNLPGIAYQHVIHEQITPSLVAKGAELGLSLSSCDLEVEHHGYSDEVVGSRNKNERNIRLFEKQLAQSPDDIYCHYKYGDFLRRLPGYEAQSQALLDRCLDLIRAAPPSVPAHLPYAGEVAALCALARARNGKHEEALAVVDEALRRFLPTPNLHYLAASLSAATGQPDAAIAHYRRCLAYRGQTLVVPIEDGITGHVSLIGIAQALWQKGDAVRAQRLARRAIEIAPGYELASMALSKMQLAAGDVGAALATLSSYLARNPESPGACQQTTLILQRLGHADQAKKMGRRAIELLNGKGATDEAARMERILAAI